MSQSETQLHSSTGKSESIFLPLERAEREENDDDGTVENDRMNEGH